MDTHKKLYRIRQGQMIAGVCNGIAAYFDIDVTLVRVLFVIGLFLSHGGFILGYFVLMVLMPIEGLPAQAGEPAADWRDRWRHKIPRYEQPMAAPESEKYMYPPPHMHRGPSVIGEVAQLLFISLAVYLLYIYVPQTDPFFDKIWLFVTEGWNWFVVHLNTPVK